MKYGSRNLGMFPNVLGMFIKLGQIDRNFLRKIINFVDLIFNKLSPPPAIPYIPQNRWWGEKDNADDALRPFKVRYSNKMIEELINKLENRKNFTRSLRQSANRYGLNRDLLNDVLEYWHRSYDFRNREKVLNKYPQYVTNIQGLDIHYVHIKPSQPVRGKVLPILLIHGWPTTNREYFGFLDDFLKPKEEYDFIFEVIVPNLPGFGYSQGTNKQGLAPYQIGIIFKNLMSRLAHQRFYIHAGDIGLWVGSHMATMYQDDVLGLHTNFPQSLMPMTLIKYILGSLNPSAVVDLKYADRMYPVTKLLTRFLENTGYYHMHATRPDTIGVGMEESPSALASWILPNIIVATNPTFVDVPDGKLLETYDLNDILDILTTYWHCQCSTTAIRVYAEFNAIFQDPLNFILEWIPTKVPYGAIKFRHEIIYQPDDFLRDKYPNLVHSVTLDYGGHFASLENPQALAHSIWTAVRKMENFHLNKFWYLQNNDYYL
ncbi:Juvenile hormone epoxide hydrolase [Eumeta japonica]|uniref:microsomal epoxide hydrolase n=1 Tax=Eumeta variegata TaxID=151549 RepID=A0A4C1VYL3_EUMVA|nr:Juvenile hormone epoxide hydrolase [Eumeta japonica]